MLDQVGELSCWNVPKDRLPEVVQKLTAFEKCTIQELAGRRIGQKAIPIERIKPDHYKRLQKLKLDDQDDLTEWHLDGTTRIWAVRFENVFHLLWWDPDHDVVESNKKHT